MQNLFCEGSHNTIDYDWPLNDLSEIEIDKMNRKNLSTISLAKHEHQNNESQHIIYWPERKLICPT